MKTHADGAQQSLLETDYEGGVTSEYDVAEQFGSADFDDDRPLRAINWNLLSADEALAEWMDLDGWIDWLRKSFGLPPTVIPPLWHRHDELVWELSALHTHWLNAYDTEGSAPGPIGWLRDFADGVDAQSPRPQAAQASRRAAPTATAAETWPPAAHSDRPRSARLGHTARPHYRPEAHTSPPYTAPTACTTVGTTRDSDTVPHSASSTAA